MDAFQGALQAHGATLNGHDRRMDTIQARNAAQESQIDAIIAVLKVKGIWRAAGGPVSAGRPYFVGERGTEMFVPRESGTVLSHEQSMRAMAGGSSPSTVRLAPGSQLQITLSVDQARALMSGLPVRTTSSTRPAVGV
jgi:hypothetical protein